MSIDTSYFETISKQLKSVIHRIDCAKERYNREPGSVKLIAVSKHQSINKILAAIAAGQCAFGENYLQEALMKIAQLKQYAIEWHYIGAIQSNKTQKIAENFSWVHSVTNKKTAAELNLRRPDTLPALNVCIQINTSQEMTKAGVSAENALSLAEYILTLPKLQFRGLMTLPARTSCFEEQQISFRLLFNLANTLREEGILLDTLSMGMSGDLEAAIAEGSTLVRVGTDIFGERAST